MSSTGSDSVWLRLCRVSRCVFQNILLKIVRLHSVIVEPRATYGHTLRSALRADNDFAHRHFRPARLESDDIPDFENSLRHGANPLREEGFDATRLTLSAEGQQFRDGPEPALHIGDVVRLNSGGPACLGVGLSGSDNVIVSWRDRGGTHEHEFPRTCVHRESVIPS